MACSNQMDNIETHIDHEKQSSSDNSDHRQRRTSTLDSGVASRGSNSPKSLSGQEIDSITAIIGVSVFFHRIIKRCASSIIMKVPAFSNLTGAIDHLVKLDHELETQWHRTWHVYWHDRHCQDYERIEKEIYQCFNALINDDKEVMIGLDSISSFKHLLITSMRICSEPNFKIEIRIGLGGTKDPLNLRAPSYAIAGVYELEKLLKLRKNFSSNQSNLEGNIPTEILINPPVLTIFCAWWAAVEVNHFDKDTTKQNANAILSYIKKYIDHLYPTSVTNYIRYEMDHENTYEIGLLNRIIKYYHFKYDDNIEKIKEHLIRIGKKHDSDREGSIRYSCMHLIGAKDIIDKNASQPSMHSFDTNENNTQNDQSINLYDCIITIGGSIEAKFNQLRYAIRETFVRKSMENNEDNYHFLLSIRMLSKAGAFPVYYRNKPSDITVDDVLQGRVNDLKLTDKAFDDIRLDISILREDIGIHLFDRIRKYIPNIQSDKIPSWKDMISALVDLCLKVWEEHAKDKRKCKCLIQDRTPFNQVCEHYDLSYGLNDNGCSIIKNILDVLLDEIGVPFGQTVEHLTRVWKRKNATSRLLHELDDILDPLLLDFVRQNLLNN